MPDLDARLLSEAAYYDSTYGTSNFADHDLVVRADEPPVPHCGMGYIVDEMLSLAGPLEGKRVLEIGCGGGLFSTYFALRGAQVTGIDVSEAALGVARRRAALSVPDEASLPQFLNVPAEMLSREFAARSFDLVFGFAVAHHFDQKLFPRAVESVLAVGGTLLLYEPTPHSMFLHRIRGSRLVTSCFPVAHDTEHEEMFHRETIAELATLLALKELPHRTVFAAIGDRLVSKSTRARDVVNFMLGRVLRDTPWKQPGCAALHRLNLVDQWVIGKLPPVRRLCRTSIIVATKTG